MDQFKNLEIINEIYHRTQDGDYGLLMKYENDDAQQFAKNADKSTATLFDQYGRRLFNNHYYDNGLVLDTSVALNFAIEFATKTSAVAVKTNSKSADHQASFNGYELKAFLHKNRCYQVCLHVFQRVLEHQVRGVSLNTIQSSSWADDVKFYQDILEVLVSKVKFKRIFLVIE